jgi:hypothetical protein
VRCLWTVISVVLETRDGDMLGSLNHRTRCVRDGCRRRNAGDSLRSGVGVPEPIGLVKNASGIYFSNSRRPKSYVCGRNGPAR